MAAVWLWSPPPPVWLLRHNLLHMPDALEVQSTGLVLAREVFFATSFVARNRGLLGLDPLRLGQALILAPAKQVHTIGMSYAIDVVFCDRDLRVESVRRSMPPQRISRFVARSWYVVELPAGVVPRDIGRGVGLRILRFPASGSCGGNRRVVNRLEPHRQVPLR